MATQQELCKSIAETLHDYRSGEVPQPTADHVEQWVKRFDPVERHCIITELAHILPEFYYSRSRSKEALSKLLESYLANYPDPWETLSETRFLNIQTKGRSQVDLLRLLNEILEEDFGMDLQLCGDRDSMKYVYIDDCIYTGNRFRYDLCTGDSNSPSWIPRHAPNGSELWVLTLAAHTAGVKYAERFIRREARRKDVTYHSVIADKYIENDHNKSVVSRYECLWPSERNYRDRFGHRHSAEDRESEIRQLRNGKWLRDDGVPTKETLFSSATSRDTVEGAMLEVGFDCMSTTTIGSMRPLGWQKLQSFGFGTFFCSYRNVANNLPMAIWWSGGGRTPLLKRKDS